MSGLKDKVVLVTGASSGIGKGTAIHMAGLGCKLSLVARNKAALEEVADECKKAGAPDVLVSSHDLALEEECGKAVEETVAHFGGLDALVNNAGVMHSANLADLTGAAFDEAMAVNLKSAVMMTQVSVQHLETSSLKAVVNVSSIAGLRAYPGAIAYKMSKAGMDQLTRCSAVELAPKGIRVNSVNPGVIEGTDVFARAGMSGKAVKGYLARGQRSHPLGRVGRVDEVAKVIAFLASEDASFVCGQTIAIDGGRSVMCPS